MNYSRKSIIIWMFLLFPLVVLGQEDRSLLNGGSDVYFVEEHGILPDGRDIHLKLSTLIRKVSNNGGGVIQFKEGTYVIGAGLTKDRKPTGGVRLYPNVRLRGLNGTVLKANIDGQGFHSMFGTVDNSVENVTFENIIFDTYIGTLNRNINDFRLAIALHWSKNVIIRHCKFIHDIGTVDTRYSHKQEDKDAGLYRVDGLVIENCEFEARILNDEGYRDITALGVTGENVFIRNNHFCVKDKIGKRENKYNPNCCLEIQGKNMWIYNNIFEGYTNAMDFTTSDTYAENRNINIYNNRILCYRGVGIWTGEGGYARGINIHDNIFKLSCDNEDKRNTGVKGCVVFVNHPRDSHNGYYSEINITNNIFDYSESSGFYRSKNYKGWINVPQNRTNEKNGISYEEFYSVIDLGGSSKVRTGVNVMNNEFVDCVFPCLYIGGSNVSENHLIKSNTFRNCRNIICLINKCDDIVIIKNKVVESLSMPQSTKVFFDAKWSGISANGLDKAEDVRFNNIMILQNEFVDDNGENIQSRYQSDFSKINIGKGNVFDVGNVGYVQK